jgi:CheY-like chemotaxis protein/DNA-directed RNA polymerase specialized sigma24 family protein
MSLSDQIAAELPYLRRYARALTGSQKSGDAYVRATLEAALADVRLRDSISHGRVELYGAFSRIWNSSAENMADFPDDAGPANTAEERIAHIMPAHRQALLLTTLEEFTPGEAGRILQLPAGDVEELVDQALAEIEDETASKVLIIEDEPLISMQLEALVCDLGHEVVGTAATRTQALEVFNEAPAGLILADIQLADGSSGIDAVEDLLQIVDVPVIFITAYPEKLLTGERPEPTYLITKPFREATVRAAISQALFFGSSRALA